jgi:hypothetical protein
VWTLGPVGFAAPLALAALAALPVALWLLRAVPPPPRRVSFPPARLLLAAERPEETPHRTPWWLVALRLLAAALVVLAAARPLLSPVQAGAPLGTLVLAIDDGWAAAGGWARASAAAEVALARAEAAGRTSCWRSPRPGRMVGRQRSGPTWKARGRGCGRMRRNPGAGIAQRPRARWRRRPAACVGQWRFCGRPTGWTTAAGGISARRWPDVPNRSWRRPGRRSDFRTLRPRRTACW